MNREIKFRAWDGHEMWTNFRLNADGTFVHESITGVATGVNRNGNAVLMQFTGLHDKNGVEIYQKDCLADQSFVDWCERCVGWRPFWQDEDAVHCHDCDGDYTWGDLMEASDFYVIGNICENPEIEQ
jgi:hypothetical protein